MKAIKKRILAVCCLFLLGLLLPTAAFADMGPKSAQTIVLKNPPKEAYYLDLLTQVPGDHDNLGDERETLDPAMLQGLASLADEGWYPALAGGTPVPMFGQLTGEQGEGGTLVHHFSYFGVPNPFRVILVTQSGEIRVSEPMTRTALQSTATYDYAADSWEVPAVWQLYLRQFLSTCIPTLLIEGLILLLFGFSLKKNWRLLLPLNLLTQLFVTATLGRQIVVSGPTFYFLTMAWVEAVVFGVEAVADVLWLKGHRRRRRLAYALAANLGSMLWGIAAIHLAGSAFYSL